VSPELPDDLLAPGEQTLRVCHASIIEAGSPRRRSSELRTRETPRELLPKLLPSRGSARKALASSPVPAGAEARRRVGYDRRRTRRPSDPPFGGLAGATARFRFQFPDARLAAGGFSRARACFREACVMGLGLPRVADRARVALHRTVRGFTSERCRRIFIRMPRMQVYLPDDLYQVVKERNLPASELLQQAVRVELRRRDLLDATDKYLAELLTEVGEPTAEETTRAQALARRLSRDAGRAAS
jgi:post-segregation antitoxin (ccd killing protein)